MIQSVLSGNWELAKRVLGYFTVYKFRIFLSLVSMVIVGLCSAATAYLVQPALDEVFINKDRDALMLVPLAFVAVMGVKGLTRFLQSYQLQYCGMRVMETLRSQLHAKMIALPVRFFEDNRLGMLMSRITSDVNLMQSSLAATVKLVHQFVTMFFLIGLVFYQNTYLAFWAVLVLPLAFYPFIRFGRKLRKLGRRNQSVMADMTSYLQEVFSGVRVVKAFANEAEEDRKFNQENSRMVKYSIRTVMVSAMSSPIMELIGALGVGLVIWYGGTQVIAGKSTPGTFFSFLAALIMMYEPVKKLNIANLEIQRALAGAERVFAILDDPELAVEEGGEAEFEPPFVRLEFRGVRMVHPGSTTPALDNIDLTVEQGSRVAIVGPSGAGKTTLINLIPRFYLPDSGEIVLNGRKLEEYTLSSLRLSMGIVSQEAFLFNATVRDNIAYSMPGTAQEEVEKAARAAFAHEFVNELPHGYDTMVGERGVKLSGGQKQRLTIARALLKNPSLLILDEATSALDTQAERIVQMALENLMKDRTSIVIAHRLSTVLSADKIVVMQDGRILDQGPHQHLLATCSLYRQLYHMQFEDQGSRDGES
jgi:subfamily B ATP-binding cassette protein MsbA